MTNGEKIKEIFPNIIKYGNILIDDTGALQKNILFDDTWWNTEYKEPTKNDLGVDAVSRKDVHDMLENLPITVEDKWFNWLQKACMRLAELPSVTPQEPRWIPVSERLPNCDAQCLVIDGDGECGVGYYREDAHAWDSPNWGWLERKDRVDNKEAFTEPCGIGKVVAWMPLPKSYREVKE